MDNLTRMVHAHACVTAENNLFPALGNVYDLLECELLTTELKHRLTTNLSSRLGCFGNIDLLELGGLFAAAHALARAFRADCGAPRYWGCPACHSFKWS